MSPMGEQSRRGIGEQSARGIGEQAVNPMAKSRGIGEQASKPAAKKPAKKAVKARPPRSQRKRQPRRKRNNLGRASSRAIQSSRHFRRDAFAGRWSEPKYLNPIGRRILVAHFSCARARNSNQRSAARFFDKLLTYAQRKAIPRPRRPGVPGDRQAGAEPGHGPGPLPQARIRGHRPQCPARRILPIFICS